MDFFYITFEDRTGETPVYPDICMGVLDSYVIAEKYIFDCFSYQNQIIDIMELDDNRYVEIPIDRNEIPILITSDPRFYLLYKGVFTYSDFRAFCNPAGENYNKLTLKEKYKVDTAKGSPTIFEYFEKLINNKGKTAYTFAKPGTWIDDSGDERRYVEETQWKIENHFWRNAAIKRDHAIE